VIASFLFGAGDSVAVFRISAPCAISPFAQMIGYFHRQMLRVFRALCDPLLRIRAGCRGCRPL